MPRFPGQRPPSLPAPKDRSGFWFGSGFIALFALGVMAFISVILPDAIFLFAVLFGFMGLVALHYFTWGRWLSRVTAEETPAEEEPWPEPPLPLDA